MLILGERIRTYLLADSTLVTLLGGTNIYAVGTDIAEDKMIFIDYTVGDDMNNIPAEADLLGVYIVVSRSVENYEQECIDIAERVDDILNKKENLLTTDTYSVLSFIRKGSSGLMPDSDTNEVSFLLSYEYILQTGD